MTSRGFVGEIVNVEAEFQGRLPPSPYRMRRFVCSLDVNAESYRRKELWTEDGPCAGRVESGRGWSAVSGEY